MDSPSSPKATTSSGTASSPLDGTSPTSPSSSSTANHVPTLPTVVVSHLNASGATRTVKARIDSNVPLDEIIRQLCSSPQLAVQGDPATFALRDQKSNELVTDDNVFGKAEQGDREFKLVSPTLEAVQLVSKLQSRDDRSMKMALFSLKTLIREGTFVEEFVARGGADELAAICRTAPLGNTLAYALASLQSLTDLASGWDNLGPDDISRLVKLVSSPATQINVLRPATAILRKLVLSGPESGPASLPDDASSSTSPTVKRYGFEPVWTSIISACPSPTAFLSLLADRISSGSASGDFLLTQASLSLVNALATSSPSSSHSFAFDAAMGEAKVGEAVVSAMQGQRATDELGPLALAYQANVETSAHRLVKTPVVAEDGEAVATLISIADRAKALDAKARGPKRAEREGEDLELRKWKTVGFEAENLLEDFAGGGMLGLVLMKRFVDRHAAEFEKVITEQLARPEKKRCPFAKASNDCAEILAGSFDWASAPAPATAWRPFVLLYPHAHVLALRLWYQMWTESNAESSDYPRIKALVRGQVHASLGHEGRRWEEVEREFGEMDYVKVRDKQMRDLALEDDLLSKAPIRNLRSRLYQESFDFVKSQRVHSLLSGSWFGYLPAPPGPARESSTPKKSALAGQKSWRFYRLAANRRHLHFIERADRGPVPPGVDWMPDRVDVSTITDIVPTGGAGSQHPRARFGSIDNASVFSSRPPSSIRFSPLGATSLSASDLAAAAAGTATTTSSYTFGLFAGDKPLGELTAPDADTYSEWVDGLNLLRPDGYISTKETADLIHLLTGIGTQVKMLDLAGERIEIPTHLAVPPVPVSTRFHYSDPVLAM